MTQQDEIGRLRKQITEAAAFLDGVADTFDALYPDGCDRAADCRAMAKKLRGET